jgi:hypothetical protein
MKLLTDELRSQLPPLYSQDGENDPMVYAKSFTPDSSWTWFVTEGEQDDGDFLFFGFVQGHEGEWGYFALSELEPLRGPLGLPLERDLYFKPARWSEVKRRERVDD